MKYQAFLSKINSQYFSLVSWLSLQYSESCKNKKRLLKYFSTYHSIYCHVEKSSWSYNIEKSVNVLKNCNHHFIFIFWCWSIIISRQCKRLYIVLLWPVLSMAKRDYILVFRMSTGMDDSIHIQIQIIKLHIIWIRFTGINWNLYTIAFFWLWRNNNLIFKI